MSNFIFNTSIFSPIHSDESINSLFSESPAGSPDFFGTKPIRKKFTDQDTVFESNSKTITKENAPTFDLMLTDIKKQYDINSEKEGKFKDTHEMLKLSMDKLPGNKVSDIPSPISKKSNVGKSIKTNNYLSVPKKDNSIKNVAPKQDVLNVVPKTFSMVKKSEKKSKEVTNKVKKEKKVSNIKTVSQQKEFLQKHANEKGSVKVHNEQLHGKQISSQKHVALKPVASSNGSEVASGVLSNEEAVQSKESLLEKFSSLIQKKNEASASSVDYKSLSAEKSSEIDISMEFDKVRSLILDLNCRQYREIVKLQDTVRQQNEATRYLMSVVDLLIEANKKLISKHK